MHYNPGNFFIEKKFTVNFRSGYKLVLFIILSFKLFNYSILNTATRFQNFSFLNYRNLPQNFSLNSSMNFSPSSSQLLEVSALIKSPAKSFKSFLNCSALGPTRTAQVSISFSYVKKLHLHIRTLVNDINISKFKCKHGFLTEGYFFYSLLTKRVCSDCNISTTKIRQRMQSLWFSVSRHSKYIKIKTNCSIDNVQTLKKERGQIW